MLGEFLNILTKNADSQFYHRIPVLSRDVMNLSRPHSLKFTLISKTVSERTLSAQRIHKKTNCDNMSGHQKCLNYKNILFNKPSCRISAGNFLG